MNTAKIPLEMFFLMSYIWVREVLMTRSTYVLPILAALFLACSGGDDDGGSKQATGTPEPTGDATETNAAPAPCETDGDCPEGILCVHFHDDATGEEGPGFCNVTEHDATGSTSSGAPAPCTENADCGPEGLCLHTHDTDGAEGLAFCRVDASQCPSYCVGAEDKVCQSSADCDGGECAPAAACAF
jgi:hypothetical protein